MLHKSVTSEKRNNAILYSSKTLIPGVAREAQVQSLREWRGQGVRLYSNSLNVVGRER